jgi:hypothetical protein
MKAVTSRCAALAAVVMLGAALPALATTVLHQDLPQLTVAADAVVVGRVIGAQSRWTEDRRRIVTDVTVEVDEALKGAPGKTVIIRQPGGRVGDVGQRVDGIASFAPGEQVLVFLEARPDGAYLVQGMSQGKFRIERSKKGKAALAIPEGAKGARVVDPDGREREPSAQALELAALKAEIRRLAAGAGEKERQ